MGLVPLICLSPGKRTCYHDIDGEYLSGYKKITIADSRFTYTMPCWYTLYEADTLAICELKRIEEGWGEINSISPDEHLRRTTTIERRYDDSLKDSIRVEIHIGINDFRGNSKRNINASFFYGTDYELRIGKGKLIDLEIQDGYGEVTLRKEGSVRVGNVGFFPIEPPIDIFEWEYFGPALAWVGIPADQNIGIDNTNVITIRAPYMDDAYFQKHVIKGEYIKIDKNTLTWRGQCFKKVRHH